VFFEISTCAGVSDLARSSSPRLSNRHPSSRNCGHRKERESSSKAQRILLMMFLSS
jgi:hypothetical protein